MAYGGRGMGERRGVQHGLLMAGQLLGIAGCAGILFAMLWMVTFGTNSLAALAQAGLVCALPLCLLHAPARRLAEVHGAKWIILFGNLAIAVCAAVMVLLAGESPLKQAGLFLYLAANGAALALLAAGNGLGYRAEKPGAGRILLESAGAPLAVLTGVFLCAAILEAHPFRTALLAGAACATLGALLAFLARGGRLDEATSDALRAGRRAGLQCLLHPSGKLGVVSIVSWIAMAAMLPLCICYMLLVSQYFAGTVHGVALVAALFLAGKAAAEFLLRILGAAQDKFGLSNYVLVMEGAVLLVASILRPYPEYLGRFALLSVVLGAGYGLFCICYTNLLRRQLPEEAKPQAEPLVEGYFHAGLAAGLAVAAVFGGRVPVGTWFLGAAAVVMAAGFLGAAITNILK